MGAAAAAALLGFLALPSRAPSPDAAERTPAGAPASASTLGNDENRFFHVDAGYRYVYGFRRGLTFGGDMGLGAAIPPVGFSGEFYVDVLKADDHGFEAVVSERIQGSPAPRAPFARISAAKRGDTLGFFAAEGLNEEEAQHVSIVKDLVALWLFPLRSDTVGEYEARFEPQPAEPGVAREKKVKLAYRSHAPNTPSILHSEHYLLWDFALHLPKEVKGLETTRLGQGQSALTAESRYELRYRSRERSPNYGAATLAAIDKEDDLALDTGKAKSLAQHPDYQNLDWGKLLNDLQNISELPGMKQLALFGDINKFLRIHPERASDLASKLLDPSVLKQGADSPEFKTLVGALATAASAEALAALRAAYDSPDLAPTGKGMILGALTTTQAPLDAATRDYLAQKMASETDPRLQQAAAYAAGSALQNAPNDASAASTIAQIQAAYAAATSQSAQLALLDVMGNSGRSEFLSTLEGVISGGSSEALKTKAEFALRFIPSAGTDLLAGLANSDAGIRGAAADALQVAPWKEAYRAPLGACAASESAPSVRASCGVTLSQHPNVAAN